ncbi:MAG: UDP-N-acetylglucosamine 1-carboxyvinyltransferase, partial [Bacteriovoracaceae bacterium]|nr:UDP-N-acetylglucosamine 1-carboxyvinyltransferase [Bacteriovoracaceae bacterium]
MDKLILKGPASLSGSVSISRAKNAYLPILAGVLLSDKPVHLKNLPNLRDIRTIKKLLSNLGVVVTEKENITTFDPSNITSFEATYDLVKTMRASILVLGPLLARFKEAKVSLPGGCAIGARPIDLHLTNMEKLGAKIDLTGGYVHAQTEGLVGNRLVLNFPSVGATENLLMAAVFAKGVTTIENVALEPEIDDLVCFLNALGSKIEGIGTATLTVTGVPVGSFKEIEYEAIADRIEASTYLMAGLITHSEITITDIVPKHIDSVLSTLEDMGAKFEVGKTSIKVLKGEFDGTTVDTAPYPG